MYLERTSFSFNYNFKSIKLKSIKSEIKQTIYILSLKMLKSLALVASALY